MSEAVDRNAFTRALLYLLDEIVGQPAKTAPGNAVLDTDTGWAHTLRDVDAARASRPIAPGSTSVAGQTAHAAYYVELLERLARGEEVAADWPGSFAPSSVDEDAWHAARERLLEALGRFRAMAQAVDDWDDRYLPGALGVLVHTAYHLGAVRQMLRVV
jgi:hypothetical protein